MRILIRLAVHHFVAQRVQAYERLVRLPLGLLLRQRTLHAMACIIECLAPDFGNAAIAGRGVERIPELLKHMLVAQHT